MKALSPRLVLVVALCGCAHLTPSSDLSRACATAAPAAAALDTVIRDTAHVTSGPKLLYVPRIEYPDVLRQSRDSGVVILDAVISVQGRAEPSSITVLRTTNWAFVASAIETVRGAQFCPGTIDHRPVRVRVQIPLRFSAAHGFYHPPPSPRPRF